LIFERQIKYYYLRFIRLRGEPHELALGMAFGVFAGMMPIMPFQIAAAVTLAIFFKGSKIAAALGTWISNPLNWYFIYYCNYKLGAFILRLPGDNEIFSSVMSAIQAGEDSMVIVGKILGAGGVGLAAFLTGGLVMGIVAAVPSYFIFLPISRYLKAWRKARKERRN
jgi:uncharacterized protein (DUF2062 family)